MPYEIVVGSSSTADPSGPQRAPGPFERLKTWLLTFAGLCLVVGVVLAALVVGLAIAGLILLALVVAICVWRVSRLLRRRAS
jgi:Flp pilus assembly protein TadB